MRVKENIRLYAWMEFLIWFIILCFGVLGVKYAIYKHNKQLPAYQIFLQDVDGLIVGSPVKYMGLQIGYIKKIKILTNDVYIKFIVTDKNVKLPQGVIATVEFSGLGGSKSLELFQPTFESKSSNKMILVKDTTRINDSLLLLNEMFDKIDAISVKLSSFANEVGVIPTASTKIDTNTIRENVKTFDAKIDEYETDRKHFQEKIKELKHE